MDEVIEMSAETADGIADCRLEPQRTDGVLVYNATILYPNVVNGFSRSEIYCVDIRQDATTGSWNFVDGEDGIHPKIKKLEEQISAIIVQTLCGR